MQEPAPARQKPRRLRPALLVALATYGIFGLWRTFPRFDSRLIGQWSQKGLQGTEATITFGHRGSGGRGNDRESRTFRWWTCGNKLLMHQDRGSTNANIGKAVEYAVRTLLFLGPPADVTEFTINRLDIYGAQLIKRPEPSDGGVTQTLELRR